MAINTSFTFVIENSSPTTTSSFIGWLVLVLVGVGVVDEINTTWVVCDDCVCFVTVQQIPIFFKKIASFLIILLGWCCDEIAFDVAHTTKCARAVPISIRVAADVDRFRFTESCRASYYKTTRKCTLCIIVLECVSMRICRLLLFGLCFGSKTADFVWPARRCCQNLLGRKRNDCTKRSQRCCLHCGKGFHTLLD